MASFDLSRGQGKFLFTKPSLFLLSCNDPLKPLGHLPSSCGDIHSCSLSAAEPPLYAGSRMYVCIKSGYFSLVDLPRVYLIVGAAERTSRGEDSFFLPHSAAQRFPVAPSVVSIILCSGERNLGYCS